MGLWSGVGGCRVEADLYSTKETYTLQKRPIHRLLHHKRDLGGDHGAERVARKVPECPACVGLVCVRQSKGERECERGERASERERESERERAREKGKGRDRHTPPVNIL